MKNEELEKFNIELKALLIKYNVSLQPQMNIVVTPNQNSTPQGTPPMEELSEVAKSE